MNNVSAVTNYLVPAAGTTNGYFINDVMPAAGKFIDFNTQSLDGQPFRPSGVIINNTHGSAMARVRINETGYDVICDAGQTVQMPYPAPINCTATIYGNDEPLSVIFVDYPVIPVALGGSGGGLTNAELRENPLSVVVDNASLEVDTGLNQPITNDQLRAEVVGVVDGQLAERVGDTSDAPWDSIEPEASLIALLKAIGITDDVTLGRLNVFITNVNERLGDNSSAAWTGTGSGTVISILKAIAIGQSETNVLLQQIVDNTTPTP